MSRLIVFFCVFMLGAPAMTVAGDDLQARTFKYFLKKAQEGDKNSQFIVGKRYESGVGTARDMDQAYMWYAKAAEQGHEVALKRMQKHDQQVTGKPATTPKTVAKTVAAQPRPTAKARPKARPRAVTQTAPPPRPKVSRLSMNTMNVVLNGNWRLDRKQAPYLPSGDTDCVQADSDQLVCFSRELQRAVGKALLTYTVKSELSGFNGSGNFNIKYMYNVSDVDKTQSAAKDPYGDLVAKEGWQPARTMRCQAQNDSRLRCTNTKNRTLIFSKK